MGVRLARAPYAVCRAPCPERILSSKGRRISASGAGALACWVSFERSLMHGTCEWERAGEERVSDLGSGRRKSCTLPGPPFNSQAPRSNLRESVGVAADARRLWRAVAGCRAERMAGEADLAATPGVLRIRGGRRCVARAGAERVGLVANRDAAQTALGKKSDT